MLTCDFVVADMSRAQPAWCEIADVLLSQAAGPAARAVPYLAVCLDRYPGCAIAVTADGRIAACRGGSVLVLPAEIAASPPWHQPLAGASLAYAWLCTGRPARGLRIMIDAAGSAAQDGAWFCSLGVPSGESPGWLRVRRWRTAASSAAPRRS